MNIIDSGRGTGKTSRLIFESAETGYVIVVPSASRVELIKKKALEILPSDMQGSFFTPITIKDLTNLEYSAGKHYLGVLFDDLDECLAVLGKEQLLYDLHYFMRNLTKGLSIGTAIYTPKR